MKTLAKIAACLLVIIVLVAAAGITFTIGWRPFIGPRARPLTNAHVQRTPRTLGLARGHLVGARDRLAWSAIHPARLVQA